jgi:hypothetical protein
MTHIAIQEVEESGSPVTWDGTSPTTSTTSRRRRSLRGVTSQHESKTPRDFGRQP